MKILKYLSVAILMFSIVSCMNNKADQKEEVIVKKEYTPAIIKPDTIIYITLDDSIRQVIKKRGKKIVYTTGFALKKELKLAIKAGGPTHAVSFCYNRAMEITDSISLEYQLKIKRLATKNRNPLNAMDENETNLFKGYVINYIGGQGPYETLTWNDEGNPVYYYPIYIDPVCLNCHGTVGEEINSEVANKIAQLYPEDRATGFQKGNIRGLWAITFPEYRITDIE